MPLEQDVRFKPFLAFTANVYSGLLVVGSCGARLEVALVRCTTQATSVHGEVLPVSKSASNVNHVISMLFH